MDEEKSQINGLSYNKLNITNESKLIWKTDYREQRDSGIACIAEGLIWYTISLDWRKLITKR